MTNYLVLLKKWLNPMSKSQINSEETSALLTRLGNKGVRKALDENRRLGIANVFSKDGKIYYQLPNGDITAKKPEST